MPEWFDAHLDLAYLAACGRDMSADPSHAGGPDLPGAVTLHSLAQGGVRAALGTIFIEPGTGHEAVRYDPHDPSSARRAALTQLDLYHAWEHRGLVELGVETLRTPLVTGPLLLGVLVEGADAIASPEELPWWVERGVRAIGLTWARSSRYAGGNAADPDSDPGLSDLGRAMVRAMDQVRVGARTLVHDASHLSDRSLAELFELTDAPIIASHSNCRALVGREALHASAIPTELADRSGARRQVLQRHLTDESIAEIARRGGVVGLNLYSPFIIPGAARDRRATLGEWADHADHVCQVVGHHRAVGLGSDMDGGFSAERLPEGIDRPHDLGRLEQVLARRGWTPEAIRALRWDNWAKFWGLPVAP